jgi:hypothetical protein
MLVLTSGLHGIEGFIGSAIQLALLEQWAATAAPSIPCLFLHGLNPYGFAWLRRVDENNVDPNRNFLLNTEAFAGASAAYGQLDPFLNPRRPPSRFDPYILKAVGLIARHGLPALRLAVAGGQYDYPQGLFFGGSQPSQLQRLLEQHLPRWLGGSQRVVHLDLHSGLGATGTYKLLIDTALSGAQRRWLTSQFGAAAVEACSNSSIAYETRGGFGRWCLCRGLAPDYLFACAEFGTYGPVRILAGLRAENQAHHWGLPAAASTSRAKQRLRELFCPAAANWRAEAIARGLDLVQRSLRGMAEPALPGGTSSHDPQPRQQPKYS